LHPAGTRKKNETTVPTMPATSEATVLVLRSITQDTLSTRRGSTTLPRGPDDDGFDAR
jgi:hypothetical protein